MVKRKSKLFRHGKFVRELNDDDDYVLQDGESMNVARDGDMLHVPMFMMDAMPTFVTDNALHCPGSLVLTDAQRGQREQLLAARDAKLTNAWKDVPALDPASTPATPKPVIDAKPGDRDAVNRAYARRDKALTDAWRTP